MDLLQFHHLDGRPVSFERSLVLIMEPHSAGSGTFVRLGPVDRPHDLHLTEQYDVVKGEVMMPMIDRLVRDMAAEPVPF